MKRLDILRPTWLEVNLDNLKYNLKNIRDYVDDSKLCGVIKADAYGIGAAKLAGYMQQLDYDYVAVATLIEALELRKEGIELPILVLGYMGTNDAKTIVNNNISQTIYTYEQALLIDEAAKKLNSLAKVHIKIDTGMSRLGFLRGQDSLEEIARILELKNLKIEGIFSHFLDAENSDKSICHRQYENFMDFLKDLEARNINLPLRHISNSGAIIDLPEYNLDMVRAGIILYGLYPYNVDKSRLDLRVTSSLKTRIADFKWIKKGDFVGYSKGFQADRDMKVATIPIGYADGYADEIHQAIKPKLRGCSVEVIGNICMDQTMLDISHVDDVEIGDIVSLFDYEDQDKIDIKWPTIMARRVPRVYIEGDEISSIDYYLFR